MERERRFARVAAARDVGAEVREIVLEPLAGERLPAFEAGAHIDVRFRADVVRQYSLLNDPDDRGRYVIAVRRSGDGGAAAHAHDDLRVGQRLEIGGPRNLFPLDEDAREVVLVAGGIGITPMLAMGHTLHRRRSSFTLHVCARSRAALPYADELDDLPFASRIAIHFDDGPVDQQLDDADVGAWSPRRLLYLCGPGGFVAAVTARARRLGWPATAIHTESFSPPPAR
jgi:vanillate monooxygenase ferredoxin subunit